MNNKMNTRNTTLLCNALAAAAILSGCTASGPEESAMTGEELRFRSLETAPWREIFRDPCTGDWQAHWFLDGLKAEVHTSDEGMILAAGPVQGDDSCHAVLWTRQLFEGDIRIDYEFTKIDDTTRNVNIVYVLASGSGEGEFTADITAWNDLRAVPSMRLYFNHMNTYHISYAAFDQGNEDPGNDYIRARRYLPETGKGLEGTDLYPDYLKTGFFQTGVPHRITIIRKGDDLFMRVRADGRELLCRWKTDEFPPIVSGRIGLRHMFTRIARYRDFSVSVPAD